MCHGAKLALPMVLGQAAAHYEVSLTAMAVPVGAFGLCMGLASLPAGLWSDRYGAARVLTAYFWLTAVGALLCWAAPNLALFTLAHALLGAAAGLYHPAGLGLLSLSVERRSLGFAMGLHGMAGPLGMAATPILMLRFALMGDWRTGFLWLAGAAAAAALCSHGLRARKLVLDQAPDRLAKGERSGLRGAPVLLLVSVIGVNAFLADGFAVMFPEMIKTRGVFVWDVDAVLASILAVGAIGQFIGGMLTKGASPSSLYVVAVAAQPLILLSVGLWLDAPVMPFLLLAGFTFFNFMTQPLENSLLAGFTARAKRGTVYALKFLVGLVIGSPAPIVAAALLEKSGFATAWQIFGVVGLLAIVLVFLFRRAEARARPALAG